jgi:hypothetical protein
MMGRWSSSLNASLKEAINALCCLLRPKCLCLPEGVEGELPRPILRILSGLLIKLEAGRYKGHYRSPICLGDNA